MRCTLALLALSAAGASAMNLYPRQSLPSCAQTCLATADTGNCGSDDTCLCKSQAFISSTTSCIQSTCTGSDLVTAEAAAQALCAAVGVTLSATPSGSNTASSSSTASSTASSASSSTTSTSGALSHGAPAFAAVAALGLAALAL